MSRHGAAYQQACNIQKNLISRLEECNDRFVASIARGWLELEYFKREVRGLPRLRPADVMELMKRARTPRHAAGSPAAPLEITSEIIPQPQPEGISLTATVPAPPTPIAPSGPDEE